MAYQSILGNITLSNSNPYSSSGLYQITGTGNYTVATGSTNGTWASVNTGTTTPSIQVKGDAEFEGNVTINGQNLAETLQRIQDRLAILVPDPKLLGKYEALQQAYEHYKLLEALCVEQYNPDK